MSKMHNKKIWPCYFNDVATGKKKFEIRKNDCNYEEGDNIVLKEWRDDSDDLPFTYSGYTGREIIVRIIYKLDSEFVKVDGLEDGYCLLGFEILGSEGEN